MDALEIVRHAAGPAVATDEQCRILGWNNAAMIGITVQAGQVEQVATQIAQFPEVSYLFMASGAFDLFAEVFCEDTTHFVNFLNRKLQQVQGVQRTETFTILRMYKLLHWTQI